MRVVTDAGSIDLGTTETTPTIGITDYSVRTTDDFGVTTVTPRGFSRTLTVKSLVPTEQVDALQQQLAAIRAQSVQWIADDRFAWLAVQGFYKSFSVELALQTVSYCSLEIEGLAETETAVDPGGDPAMQGSASTLLLLQPVAITDAVLIVDSVPENDAAAWDSTISYPANARVIRTTTHRVYQSTSVHNQGNAPETSPAVWLDLGPTNRWAMFDQALGTATTAIGWIVLTLAAGSVPALALLDVVAATIRVQVADTPYDETQPAGPGAVTFLDMPASGGAVTVTIAGSGQVSVGTLIAGPLVSLGVTEASPTAGITDYSLKMADDFGAVMPVERAWSKNMAAKALISTEAVDIVAGRIAAVRSAPSLWIGQAGLDSLTVYGFWKGFSIEVAETTATLSLSIEGLSKAAKVDPLTIAFDNVIGDNKPDPGATRNVPRGEWSATTAYIQGDIVTYQGSSYIAGQNVPAGTYPTDAVYWDPLAEGGAPGLPGPAGRDGTTPFVHVAYANSADGSTDFIAGIANPGRSFIGIYTDTNSAGSGDYHAYNWTRLTGANGTNGTNGTPGPIGADGRQSYVHFAYADSINGQYNFTTGDPGGRSFIGVYSDYTLPDSNDPSAYAWSLIRGADGSPGPVGGTGATGGTGGPGPAGSNGVDGLTALNIHTVGAVSYDGHQLLCTSNANNWTTNGAYSSNVIPGGVALTFQRPNWYDDEDAFIGISSTPTASIDYPAVEFAWRMYGADNGGGPYQAEVWHAGSSLYSEAWSGDRTYSVRYDVNTGIVTWYRNDQAVATYSAGANRSFGFQATCSRHMSVANVAFTAAGGTGATGGAGPPGQTGPTGNNGRDGDPGPPGTNGTNGVSPAPKYPAMGLYSAPNYYQYGSVIPLNNGQTLTLEGYAFVSASYTGGGPGVVAISLQISFDAGGSWSQIGADQTAGLSDGDGQDLDVFGSYTNTSGGRQAITVRAFVNRNAQTGVYLSNGFLQPS